MIIDLKDKNALVCGSTDGIGKAIAVELATAGANVTLFARNLQKLNESIQDLDTSKGQKHNLMVADFFDNSEVLKEINNYIDKGNTIHILINNTGGPAHGAAIDSEPELFLNGFKAHIVNNQNITRAVVPGMKDFGFGRIINIISISVKTPIPGLGVSNTIRGAVASWAKTLSNELGPFGITVNNLLPGYTKTGRLDDLFSKKAEEAGISPDEYEIQAAEKIPVRRMALPKEMGYAATFLASDQASYINGINLPVDGGIVPTL